MSGRPEMTPSKAILSRLLTISFTYGVVHMHPRLYALNDIVSRLEVKAGGRQVKYSRYWSAGGTPLPSLKSTAVITEQATHKEQFRFRPQLIARTI